MAITIVVSIGAAISAILVVVALNQRRAKPVRRVPWILAVIALSLDVALHVAVSIAAIAAGGWEGAWMILGTFAIAGVLGLAILQPRLAGWWFIASAALMPLILLVAQTFDESGREATVPVAVMLAFYSTRALVVGGLLVLSAMDRRH